MKNNNINIIIILSIVFIIFGILLIFISKTENILNFHDKTNLNENQNLLQKKNYCILKILNHRNKQILFLTSKKKFIIDEKCNNKDTDNLPILTLNIENKITDYSKNIDFFVDSYLNLIHINPSILNSISEIKIEENELQFFLDFNKIRVDIKDYREKNWEKKFISVVIWLKKKNIQNAYLDIRDEDSLLIFDGEL